MVLVSVVIPTLNEEMSIVDVISKARRVLESLGVSYEIVVVDSSTDRTPLLAESLGARVVRPDRLGYGYAYLYGFNYSSGDVLVLVDGDGTYDLMELPALLRPVLEGRADVVVCSRFKGRILPGAMSWLHRNLGNPLLTWLLNKFYDVGVSDSQCGFRVITRQALEMLRLDAHGMEFATDMLIKARRTGLRVVEVPVTYYPRVPGSKSKLRSFRDGWRHVELILGYAPRYTFYVPAFAFIGVGFLMLILAFIWIWLGIGRGFHLSLLGGLSILVGVQLLFIGAVLDISLAARLGLEVDRYTKWIIWLTPLRALILGGPLVLAGGLYWIFLVVEWAEGGFRVFPHSWYNVVASILVVLGVLLIVGSFSVSTMRRALR